MRVLVIGSTAISAYHIKAIKNSQFATLAGVFTRHQKEENDKAIVNINKIFEDRPDFKVSYFSGKNENSIFDELTKVIKEQKIELVINASASTAHAKVLETLINVGTPVISEKPFTMTSIEAQKILELAKEKKVFVSDGLMYMHSDWWNGLDEFIKEIKSPLVYVSASYKSNIVKFTSKTESGGGIYNLGVYPLSAVLRVASLYGNKNNFDFKKFIKPNEKSIVGKIDSINYFGSPDPEVASISYHINPPKHPEITLSVDTDTTSSVKENWLILSFLDGSTLTIEGGPFIIDPKKIEIIHKSKDKEILDIKCFEYNTTTFQRQLEDSIRWIKEGRIEPPPNSGLQHSDTLFLVTQNEHWYNSLKC